MHVTFILVKRVNWICAIIISMFLKNAITIQLTMPVPLQFCTCLKNAIMYARSRRWPPADVLERQYIRIDNIALLIPSLSLH
jgi:hypothetical protein